MRTNWVGLLLLSVSMNTNLGLSCNQSPFPETCIQGRFHFFTQWSQILIYTTIVLNVIISMCSKCEHKGSEPSMFIYGSNNDGSTWWLLQWQRFSYNIKAKEIKSCHITSSMFKGPNEKCPTKTHHQSKWKAFNSGISWC